jgi:hypothetical protein
VEAAVTDVVADTRSGSVFFTGWFGNPESPTLSDAFVGKFSGDGDLQSLKVRKADEFQRGQAIVLDPKGKNIYIAGSSGTDEDGGGVLIMRATSKAKIRWARRVNTDWFRAFGRDLVVSANGKRLHIVGSVGPEGFGVGAGLMLTTNTKAKNASGVTMQPAGEETLDYDFIGLAVDGTLRIFGGLTDGTATLGSYTD